HLSDLFYLDVSSSFTINDIASMPWSSLPSSPLTRTSGTACINGSNKNRIIFIGGPAMVGNNFSSIYDITTKSWSNIPTPANFNATVIQYILSEDIIYIYGGLANAVLLNNTSILYIGGRLGDTSNITHEK
ncbi:18214_t:CDS:2, partial [Racocetra fulgida]